MRGCIQLPNLLKQGVHLWARFQLGDLRFEFGFFGRKILAKIMGNRPATTLHDILNNYGS